jgi:THO complex subunit 1 transcription elongation factor
LGAKLADLHQRAVTLLRNVEPPHGAAHLTILESILTSKSSSASASASSSAVSLSSEEQWRNWKKNRCQPDLDKPLSSSVAAVASRKRKAGPLGNGGAVSGAIAVGAGRITEQASDLDDDDDEAFHSSPAQPSVQQDLPAVSRKMRKVVPALDSHLADYIVALDPDAGIEAEYHPKNNALFAWRALRLLSSDYLGDFKRIRPDGDFEAMVRHVYYEQKGVTIAGEAPSSNHHAHLFFDEDEEEPQDEDASQQSMEDFSQDEQPRAEGSVEENGHEKGGGDLNSISNMDVVAHGPCDEDLSSRDGRANDSQDEQQTTMMDVEEATTNEGNGKGKDEESEEGEAKDDGTVHKDKQESKSTENGGVARVKPTAEETTQEEIEPAKTERKDSNSDRSSSNAKPGTDSKNKLADSKKPPFIVGLHPREGSSPRPAHESRSRTDLSHDRVRTSGRSEDRPVPGQRTVPDARRVPDRQEDRYGRDREDDRRGRGGRRLDSREDRNRGMMPERWDDARDGDWRGDRRGGSGSGDRDHRRAGNRR